MKGIYCGYYDEEMEQDVPLQPSLTEAVSFFKSFIWENKSEESSMKVIILQIPDMDDASLQISTLEENKWCISAHVSNRRRFLGPFFKRNTFKIFIDKNELETIEIITSFYQNTLEEFTALLKSSK
ncbi:hypothetical protein [Pseudoalteromonas ostreae]|uniref:hypothetical protein n=1 Tax=Pseudoalteromonas ostreae TaxID=2774154 RepID=UPI001B36B9DA|nr:hypothetical protein [Pseudoalteromonas ostreae]